jgi:hypothetical protein
VYSDAACSTPLNGPLALSGGAASAYLNATGPGVATLTATVIGQTTQTDAGIRGAADQYRHHHRAGRSGRDRCQRGGQHGQQASLRAVVRDGTVQNNLVKNATVAFSILTDPSGGSLTQPALVRPAPTARPPPALWPAAILRR